MAARILMVVAVLMALYGCGQSLPEPKDSFEGVEHLEPEASAFGTVLLTGQKVELESDVVEQADWDDRHPAYAYLECGYAGGA